MSIASIRFRLSHWILRWTVDSEGGITLTLCGCLNFTKYKESTIIKWGRGYTQAPKHINTGMGIYQLK